MVEINNQDYMIHIHTHKYIAPLDHLRANEM